MLKVAFNVKSGVTVGQSTTITLTDQGAKTVLGTVTLPFTSSIKMLNIIAPQDGASFTVDEGSPLAIRMRILNHGDSLKLNTGTTLPAGAVMAGDTLFQWTPNQTQAGAYPVRLIYTNEGGGADTVNLNITVNDKNAAPVWPAQIDTLRVNENEELSHSFTAATDADPTDIVSYTALNTPAGSQFTAGALLFSWKPAFGKAGTYKFSLVASDNRGGRATKVIVVIVEKVNRKPVLSIANKNLIVDEKTPLSFQVGASDPDGDPVRVTAEEMPSGATFSGTVFNYQSPAAGTYTVRFIGADPAGLADTQFVAITVNAVNFPPRFTALRDTSLDAGTALQITLAATDPNEGDALTYSVQKRGAATTILDRGAALSGAVLSWTPAASDLGQNIVYLRVTDSQGLYDEAQLTITVTGRNITAPPAFKPLETMTVAEGDNVAFNLPLVNQNVTGLKFWASDKPQGSKLDSLTGRFTWQPSLLQSGSYTVTFGVTDGKFQDTKKMLIVVTERDVAPTLNPVGNLSVREGELLRVRLAGVDLSGEAISFSATGLPVGADLYPQGLLMFRPGYTQSGIYTVTFTVTDASDNKDQETVSLTVQDANRTPVLTVPNQSVSEGATLSFTVSATDPDGDQLTYAAANLPDGAAFNSSTRAFTWTPELSQSGNYTVLFTANDGKDGGLDSANVIISVGNVNRPPVLDPIVDQSLAEGETLAFSVVAADPDEANRLTISATGLPQGATLSQSGTNPATATVTLTPGYTQAGIYKVKFTARDNDATSQLSVSRTMTLEVTDTDVLPAFTGSLAAADSAVFSVSEGQVLEIAVTASDAGGDALGYSVTGMPLNATASLTTEPRKVVFSPDYTQSGRHEFTVAVTDGRNEVVKKVVVNVAEVNRAPRVPDIADQKVTEGDIISFMVDATDPDGDTFTVHTAGDVPFLTQGATPPAKIRDGNVFLFDTALLPKDQPIASAFFKFWAEDSRGGVSDTVTVEIAVERKVNTTVPQIVSGTIFSMSNTLLGPLGMGGFIIVSGGGSTIGGFNMNIIVISGFIQNVPVPTLASAGDETTGKVKQDPRKGVYTFLAGDLTSQFYGIRRGWGLDLTALGAAGADSFPTGTGSKITLKYSNADLPTEVPNFTEARLSVFGYDAVQKVWVMMDSVSVDTVKNEAQFVPINPQISEYTIGAVLDVVAPLVTNLKVASGGVTVSPAPIDTLHGLSGTYEVRINVTDDEIVSSANARLYYSVNGGAYKDVSFNRQSGNLFTALIQEGAQTVGTLIDYYIVVQDNMNTTTFPSGAPEHVNRFILAEQTQQKGDIDGNKKIDVFDLLGLLKVMSGAQPSSFASDIDGNGKTDVFDLLALLKLMAK
ncbi:Ig-like domain-containing protein [bacterium]|nr:Ig-like domain-containing protein [bacterium]